MAIHLVGLAQSQIRLNRALPFRGVRRTRGVLFADGPLNDELFLRARIDCQLGAEPRTGGVCLGCPRLLAYEAGPHEGEVTVRCLWTHHDPVRIRMTCAGVLKSVVPETSCAEALELADRAGVHRLLVVEHGVLRGIVCRCDLEAGAEAELSVAEMMCSEVFAVAPSSTLGEAAAAMSALNVGALPVVSEDRVVGMITRGDLERAGAPADLFE